MDPLIGILIVIAVVIALGAFWLWGFKVGTKTTKQITRAYEEMLAERHHPEEYIPSVYDILGRDHASRQ